MFNPLLRGLAGLVQRKICLVDPILYSVRCPCSFQLSFMWYPQCFIQPIIGGLILGSRGHLQQGVPGRHPYLVMEGYTLYVPVLWCWYLVRLTKMLWAAVIVVYPLPWPLLVGESYVQFVVHQPVSPSSGQQCSHSGGVCSQIHG